MSSSASASSNKSVHAETDAKVHEPPTKLVAGESADSVTVQSQLATSTVAGEVTSRSNIGQVVNDLGAAHTAHSGWVESETAKITQWGQSEIARILAQTKGMEQQLIKQAQEKQIELDNRHKGELAKLVQQLDLQKAAELKELEDGLQRQIQGVLTTSKNDINRIETEMNTRKMELLKQSQVRSAKEIDALSNLVVETKLVPSQTRTVIETNTNTGSVIAVATGGHIATGAAASEVIGSQRVMAVPNAGELRQETDVKTGDMVRTRDNVKVGEGAIVSTMTNVTEQRAAAPLASQVSRGPVNTGVSTSTASSTGQGTTTAHAGDNDIHHGATQHAPGPLPTDAGRQAGSYAGPVFHHDGQKDAYAQDKTRTVDAAYGKHQEHHAGGGLMSKVKSALTGHSSEPKSNDSTRRV